MVIWLVGLSGSGKTTIGNEIYRLWKGAAINTVMVDGDDVRRILQHDKDPISYTIEGRLLNARRIVQICSWLDRQEINVVCCILCIFEEIMENNRNLFSQYFQVYLDAPMELLKKRDVKGLYRRWSQGLEKNVVGMDIPFHPPPSSDIAIQMNENALPPEKLALQILQAAGVCL